MKSKTLYEKVLNSEILRIEYETLHFLQKETLKEWIQLGPEGIECSL
jgi:hypothetical protein